MTIENKECPDAEGQYNKSSLSRELSVTVKLQLQYQYGFARRFSQRKRCSGGWEGGWQPGLEPSSHDRPSK